MFSSNNSQVANDVKYIEDYFSTFLYSGDNTNPTVVTNGIDLATKGGLVWLKGRSGSFSVDRHELTDTARGVNAYISSNTTYEQNNFGALNSFNSDGFTLGAAQRLSFGGGNYVSWSFAKTPKFFDIVTYTGDGNAGRAISHSLASTPGFIVVKQTSASGQNWRIWHRSVNSGNAFAAFTDSAFDTTQARFIWGNNSVYVAPTSTTFTVSDDSSVNSNGATYVAYLFAHDAGGFGLTGTDNVISCGSFTKSGSSNVTVNLGFEPQWILMKSSSNDQSWFIFDTMRGMSWSAGADYLNPNNSNAETPSGPTFFISATGFEMQGMIADATYIYIAIRRGPMKVPTDATKVFAPSTVGATNNVTVGFPSDSAWFRSTGDGNNWRIFDRLRSGFELATNLANAEGTYNYSPTYIHWDSNSVWNQNLQNAPLANYFFRRAPSTFDEVCYTGNGSTQDITHNLGVAPELMIVKMRSATSSVGWIVYAAPLANASTSYLVLNSTDAVGTGNTVIWNSTAPTSSVFSLGASSNANTNGATNVAYLWATNAGVTKVGTYTGNGSSQTINCGFTGGARFVMIKATSTTGNWLVADSARGIVSGNDPALYLNSTSAEVTGFDWIDADNSGFIVNETSTIAANTNGVQYLFLAYA